MENPTDSIIQAQTLGSGMQHKAGRVLSESGQMIDKVIKVPTRIGMAWDNLSYGRAAEDLSIQQQAGLPLAPTQIIYGPIVSLDGKAAKQHGYGVLQDFLESGPVSEDLVHRQESIRAEVKRIYDISFEMFADCGFVPDLVGFAEIKKLLGSLRSKDANWELNNLYLSEAGTPVLIDTLLLDPRKARKWSRDIVTNMTHVQVIALFKILEPYYESYLHHLPSKIPASTVSMMGNLWSIKDSVTKR